MIGYLYYLQKNRYLICFKRLFSVRDHFSRIRVNEWLWITLFQAFFTHQVLKFGWNFGWKSYHFFSLMFFLSSLSLCDVMKERSINAIEIGESHERDNFHMNWVFLEHGSFISLHLYFKNTGCWNEMKDRLVSYWCLSSKFEVQTRPPRQGRSEIRDKLPFFCPQMSTLKLEVF